MKETVNTAKIDKVQKYFHTALKFAGPIFQANKARSEGLERDVVVASYFYCLILNVW